MSQVWRSFFQLLGISVSQLSSYHPQTNGQTERKIQEIGSFFATVTVWGPVMVLVAKLLFRLLMSAGEQ